MVIKDTDNRRGKMFGHLVQHDRFLRSIMEGKIEGNFATSLS